MPLAVGRWPAACACSSFALGVRALAVGIWLLGLCVSQLAFGLWRAPFVDSPWTFRLSSLGVGLWPYVFDLWAFASRRSPVAFCVCCLALCLGPLAFAWSVWLLEFSRWRSAFGHCSLAFGRWPLTFDCSGLDVSPAMLPVRLRPWICVVVGGLTCFRYRWHFLPLAFGLWRLAFDLWHLGNNPSPWGAGLPPMTWRF